MPGCTPGSRTPVPASCSAGTGTRLSHDLPHRDGLCTVHVLDREHRPGNAVLLDLTTMEVRPLP